jgi:ATP-binding cassette subfamily F protein uup
MAPPPLLTLRDVHLTFGGTPLLTGAELSVAEGERLCLVGRNGSGKSTLLKIAAGMVEMDSGERFFQPGRTMRYLPQEPDLSAYASTLDYVNEGLTDGDDPYRGAYLLEVLGLTGQENPNSLSGGEARRAALARTLAPEPDILLLDEPTNHLDLPAIEWLEEELRSLKSAIVLISHDRRFLENLSRATVWIDRGIARRLDKGFAHFEAWRDEVFEQEEIDQQKLAQKIKREEHWMTYGVTARRKRNMRRVRELADLRKQKREHRGPQGTAKLSAAEGETSGKLVIEAKRISKSYGDRSIVQDFSSRIQRGDRIGLVGPNGAGKTTLLKMLTGELTPDTGSVRLGSNLEMVTLDQKRENLDLTDTLASVLTGGRGDTVVIGDETKARHVLHEGLPVFARAGADPGRRAVRRRARPRHASRQGARNKSNLMVLDEPTNDLDLETLDLLAGACSPTTPGTALIVSHDRDFLDRVATSVIVSEGDGLWREYAGGYSDMLAQRGEGVTARKAEKSAPAKKEKPASGQSLPRRSRNQKSKLTFTQQHLLKNAARRRSRNLKHSLKPFRAR